MAMVFFEEHICHTEGNVPRPSLSSANWDEGVDVREDTP